MKKYGSANLPPKQPHPRRQPKQPIPTRIPRRLLISWAAGFFDGEGTIGISHRKGTRTHFLAISAPQIVEDPLHLLQSLFGGSVRPKKDNRPRLIYLWEVCGDQAAEALKEMRRFLLVKQSQADLAIRFQKRIGRPFKGSVSTKEHNLRAKMRKEMQGLNHHSYPQLE